MRLLDSMEDSEKISVIVPVMNVEPFLRQCLDSITSQTYSDLEIILIYTKSKDQTLKICEDYASGDDRIVLLRNETGLVGPGVSRNIGLQNMTGELLGFVDADDCIANDMFQVLYDNMKTYDADVSICKETRNKDDIEKKQLSQKIVEFDTQEALAEFLVGSRFHGELWNKLFKKECIQNTEFLKTEIGEDITFVWTVIQNAKKIVYTDAKRYFYRFNPNGISKQHKIENITQKKDIYSSIGQDVSLKYPKIKRQLNNRIAIMNAQNYVAVKLARIKSEEVEKELLSLRKKYKFRKDDYRYNKKESVQAKLFELSPKLLFILYRVYFRIKGRG